MPEIRHGALLNYIKLMFSRTVVSFFGQFVARLPELDTGASALPGRKARAGSRRDKQAVPLGQAGGAVALALKICMFCRNFYIFVPNTLARISG